MTTSRPAKCPITAYLLIISFLLSVVSSCTKPKDQQPFHVDVLWSKAWGGTGWEYGGDITADATGHYYFVANASSTDGDLSGYDSSDTWLAKLGGDGQTLWQKPLPLGPFGSVGKLISNPDDGVLTAGISNISVVYALKYDGSGNLQWKTEIDSVGGGYNGIVTGVLKTSGGYVTSHISYHPEQWSNIRFLDNGGDLSTTNVRINGDNNCLAVLPGTAYLAAGGHYTPYGSSSAWSPSDATVEKLDAQGNMLWRNTMGGTTKVGNTGDDYFTAAVSGTDGSVLLAGTTNSDDNNIKASHGGYDAWLVKIDANGKVLWNKTYGGSGTEIIQAVVHAADGNFFVAATTDSNDGDVKASHGQKDIWLFKVDGNGNLLGGQTLGGSNDDLAVNMVRDNNGDYVLIGTTFSNDGDVTGAHGGSYQPRDAWIVKLREH